MNKANWTDNSMNKAKVWYSIFCFWYSQLSYEIPNHYGPLAVGEQQEVAYKHVSLSMHTVHICAHIYVIMFLIIYAHARYAKE